MKQIIFCIVMAITLALLGIGIWFFHMMLQGFCSSGTGCH
ncbi:hypothetical protein ANH9381_0865 [Aggregatibacter actinomycetemcomitans ANH9381]|nr:hypothetical protein ANH9381_0865 [Aggregatibacter actinomycetemcomitans ANH9381]